MSLMLSRMMTYLTPEGARTSRVEAGEGVGAPAVVEDAIAADAFVDDGEVAGGGVGVEADGEEVGPGWCWCRGAVPAVGDAVAEGYDGGGVGVGWEGASTSTPLRKVPDCRWGRGL